MERETLSGLSTVPLAEPVDRRHFIVRAAPMGVSFAFVGNAPRGIGASANDSTPAADGRQDPNEPEGTEEMADTTNHYVVADDEAEPIWFLGTLATIKGVGAQTGDAFAMVEFTHPDGFATPLHVHHSADEAFYVLVGAIRGFCGEREWHATTGSFVWLPRGIPHEYAVEGDETLRTLAMTVPAGFDRFIVEGGEPALERAVPPPGAPDIAKLDAAGAKYGIETLGPPRQWAAIASA